MVISLTGKVALVTGAGVSIGFEIAARLAQAYAAVLINDKDAGKAAAAAETLRGQGGRAIGVGGDIAQVSVCRALVERCVQAFGRLDIACCNDGITSWGKFLDYTETAFAEAVCRRYPAPSPGPEWTNDSVSPLFHAVIEASEEAIYNSLCMADTVTGNQGHTAEALLLG